MGVWWRQLLGKRPAVAPVIDDIRQRRDDLARLDDERLKEAGRRAATVPEVIAVTAAVAARVIGLQLFDVQLAAAAALARGQLVEMQTGEGKTLAAVPAVVWHARSGRGVHVLTANDYLARRDAEWMGGIYEWLDLSVAAVDQTMTPAARRAAYRADVTYATANEVGFDYLRDGLALDPADQVHRPFAAALVDEADSILIDEARVPLVIAGGAADAADAIVQADRAIRELSPGRHYTVEQQGRNVVLTAAGVTYVERAMGCANLFDPDHQIAHAAVQDALHAHVLLRKDVDYVVQDGAILPVDEFKGRIVQERRWPAGLHAALEAKERVTRKAQGRVLGSITVEHLVGLYATVCGMTGTAVTQAAEFRDVYGLDVVAIPTNRPIVRLDHADEIFVTRAEKDARVREEIRRVHATGRPVLVGTASVADSERLSRALGDLPHHVLNARHEAEEAAIIARAGERGAVTISTNMAGRGVDIQLGPGVAALGGLHVVGTVRHDSRRIDHQLRGRAGRQGDPGSSRFFVSREDPIFVKHAAGDAAMAPDQAQRIAEGQNLDIRRMLAKYESVIEGMRLSMADRRQRVLDGRTPAASERARVVTLLTLDDLWADFLAAVAELQSGTTWISLGYGNPLGHYLGEVHAMFGELERSMDAEVEARVAEAGAEGLPPRQRGATWTYLTTDEPFGPMSERIVRGLVAALRRR